jgi:hypothetical protein
MRNEGRRLEGPRRSETVVFLLNSLFRIPVSQNGVTKMSRSRTIS